jgi:hypothetical protein
MPVFWVKAPSFSSILENVRPVMDGGFFTFFLYGGLTFEYLSHSGKVPSIGD